MWKGEQLWTGAASGYCFRHNLMSVGYCCEPVFVDLALVNKKVNSADSLEGN